MEDVVVSMQLTPRQVLRVFYETCSAVAHMHSQDPPIIHRDLKVSLCHSAWWYMYMYMYMLHVWAFIPFDAVGDESEH